MNHLLILIFYAHTRYLENNLPSFDEVNKGSLGFLTAPNGHLEFNEGVANVGTNLSLTVRSEYLWAAKVSLSLATPTLFILVEASTWLIY
mgnify:FL=1